MALSTCLFKLEYENGNKVQLSRKDEGRESYLLIAEITENGSWADWESIATIMNNCFTRKVKEVEEIMKG